MANRIETSLLVKGLTADTYALDVRGKTFVDGDIEINGNVNIVGTATTINTQTVQARDNKIELNYSGSTSTAIGGGIEILSGRTDGSSVSLTIDTDRDWNSNTGFNITGRTSDATTNGLKVVNSLGTDNLVVKNDGYVRIGTTTGVRAEFDINANGGNGLYKFMGGNGNWGININPYDLTAGTSVISSAYNGISIGSFLWIEQEPQIITRNADFNWDIYGSSDWNIRYYGTANKLFTVKNDGNVGIGTSTPSQTLSIYKSGFTQANLLIESDSYTSNIILNSFKNSQGTSGGSTINFKSNGVTYGDISTVSSNSRFIINSSNGYDLFLTNANSAIAVSNQTVRLVTNNENRLIVLNDGNVGIGTLTPDSKLVIKGIDSSSSNFGLKVQNSGGTDNLVVRNDATVVIGNSSEYQGSSIYFDRVNRKTYFNPNLANGSNINDIEINARYTKWGTNSGNVFGLETEYVGLDVFDDYSTFRINKQAYNSHDTYTPFGVAWREGSGGTPNTTNVGSFIYNRTINKDDIYDRTLNGIKIDTSLGSWTNTTGTSTNIGLNVTVGNADVNYAAVFNGGNVGIGTSTPTSKLHTMGSFIFDNGATTQNSFMVSDDEVRLWFGKTSSNYNQGILANHSFNPKGLTFIVNEGGSTGNFAMYLTEDKNVGVGFGGNSYTGVTSRMHIRGSGTTSSGYGLKVQDSSGTDNLVVRNDGNVGIGTSTPTAKLSLSGSVFPFGSFLDIKNSLYPDIGTKIDGLGNITIEGPSNAGYSQLLVKNTAGNQSDITIDSNNIGSSLNLKRTNQDRYSIVANNTNSVDETLYVPFRTFLDSSHRILSRTGTTEVMYLDATVGNSKVGIGTISPSSKLHVVGSDSSSSNYGLKVQDSGGTDNFVVRNDGNVGIGTMTPSEKLHVSGNTKITGTLNIGTIGSGSPLFNLGLDSSGNVVTGTTGGGVTTPTSFYSEPSSTAVTWNVSGNSTNYKLTLTANTTLNLSNVRNGDYGTIILTQDAGGNRTVTLGTVNGSSATHKVVNGGAGLVSLTATANAIDILSFTYDGTNMYWNKGLNYT